MSEALVQGGWKALAVLLMLLPLLVGLTRRERVAAALVAILSVAAGAALWWIPAVDGPSLKSAVLRGNTLLAGLLLVVAVVLATTDVTRLARRPLVRFSGVIVLIATILVLDGIELADQVRTLAFLKESGSPYVAAAAVMLAAIALAVVCSGWLGARGAVALVAPWSTVLYLVAIRAAFEPFLLSSAEGIISRVGHDFVHVLIMLTVLPDHAYLVGFLWNLIGLTFSKSTALVLNVLVFLGITVYLVVRVSRRPLPVHHGLRAPERRAAWAAERRARRLAAAPAIIAAVLFAVLAVRSTTFRGTPEPPDREQLATREVAGGLQGVIDPAALDDGALHVWTHEEGDRSMRMLAIRKPDGSLAVCLDACLVCAPDGYAELGEDLFCLYCGTPIPISTVGEPGGCNPVPFPAEERDGELVFDVADALEQWEQVTQGR